ncbi:E3 ubiquitin-protein ligase TRIM71-like [Lingula anatina]|uniref:E3 ubiquitin-protein ligase TRIM71-like n=1 Tax=Lingula anatina TaxID=7574 RepID=A0A1S3JDY6_LINAN|nr:E3 ubiquitin-protein ligase TRIM71-like [Lingula anatina]|eukprot:XP_013408630.1 E3 ubiquitin-protein ligase TRIM71-like [Lingula anatina]
MNEDQKKKIRQRYVYLVNNLTDPRSTGLAAHLYQDGVIELRDRQIVEKEKATEDAIKHLLDAVMNSSHSGAFDCFLKLLEEYGQDYLAIVLRQSTSSDGTGLCDVCPEDNKSPATSVCLDCKELMCSTCAGCHKRTRILKEHKLQELPAAVTDKCQVHPSIYLKSYCPQCDVLVCERCMVDTHKGHTDAWKDAITAAEDLKCKLNGIIDEIKDIPLNKHSIEKEEKEQLADLDEQRQRAKQAIDTRVDEVCKLAKVCAEKAKEEVDKAYLDIKLQLQITNKIASLEKQLKAYENMVNDASVSSVVKNHAEWETSLKEMLQTHSPTSPVPALRFQTITWTETAIQQAMGAVVIGEITPTLITQHQLQCSKDPLELPIAVDSMPGGDVVVGTGCNADKNKHRIITSSSTGDIKKEIKVTGLKGLTVLRDGTIAATVCDDSTREVRIYTKDGGVKSSFKCSTPGRITVNHEGQLVVMDSSIGTCNNVMVYHTDGTQIRVFSDISSKPAPYFNDITTTPSGDVIVSDPNDCCIRVYTPEGQLRYTYGGEGVMKCSHGVCVDEDGTIFISDNLANNIHQVSPAGQFMRYVLTDKDGLRAPRVVCINQEGHLVVAQQNGWIKTYNTPGGDVVVGTWCTADITKRRVIICSSTGDIKKEIKVTGLRGLTVLRDGTIAATVWDGSTQEVRIYTKDGGVKSSFKCSTPGRITVNHEGQLAVMDSSRGTYNNVMVYHTDGTQVRVFSDISSKPAPYFKYISTTGSGDVIVSDPNDRWIRVYTPEGQLRYTYGGEGVMKGSHGVCVDEDGTIFICDFHAYNIHQVSPAGQFMRYVLTAKDGLRAPHDVCINQEGHLVVAQEDGWIKTYKYK